MHSSHHHAPSHRARCYDDGIWSGETEMSVHNASHDDSAAQWSSALREVVRLATTLDGEAQRTLVKLQGRVRCRILEKIETQSVESEETP